MCGHIQTTSSGPSIAQRPQDPGFHICFILDLWHSILSFIPTKYVLIKDGTTPIGRISVKSFSLMNPLSSKSWSNHKSYHLIHKWMHECFHYCLQELIFYQMLDFFYFFYFYKKNNVFQAKIVVKWIPNLFPIIVFSQWRN